MSDGPDFDWQVELVEPVANPTIYFTGVRASVVNGTAHLLLYVEQPCTFDKATEFVVVARLTTPLARAKAVLDFAAERLARPSSNLSSRVVDGVVEVKH